VRYLCAAPDLIKSYRPAKQPGDLKSWPWIALSAAQFGGSEKVTLTAPKHEAHTICIRPVFVSEGVTSLREAAMAGTGVSVLPDWLVREDLVTGRLVRLLPQWNAPEFPVHVIYPGQRLLPARVRAFVDFAVAFMTAEMHAPKRGQEAAIRSVHSRDYPRKIPRLINADLKTVAPT
jgi:DNA-binding transcriptional LysR family regulator